MTTREYILQDARRVYPKLAAIDGAKHLVLELNDYTREDRARILYNHLWHADLSTNALNEVAAGGCIDIVDHPNYSPRLIEYCTSSSFDSHTPEYVQRFLESLEHPERLWQIAFEDHLTELQQLVTVALATLPTRVDLDDLEAAHESLCRKRGVSVSAARFRAALQVLEGSFLTSEMVYGTAKIRFHNPSIRAFVLDWLGHDESLVRDLIDSSVFFEQVGNLHQFATGYRGVTPGKEVPSTALADIISSAHESITRALMSLLMSPTPERGSRYYGDTNPEVSWFEDRMLFLMRLPAQVRPQSAWVASQIEAVATRWTKSTGHKASAAELMESVEVNQDGSFSNTTIERARLAFEGWLARDLDDTRDDWVPYLERLERIHGDRLEELKDVASKFRRHAMDELFRWSPSPPGLSELIEYSKRFQLDELTALLEEKAEEDERREEGRDDRESRRHGGHGPVVHSRWISDQDLRQMFSRLASDSKEHAT